MVYNYSPQNLKEKQPLKYSSRNTFINVCLVRDFQLESPTSQAVIEEANVIVLS